MRHHLKKYKQINAIRVIATILLTFTSCGLLKKNKVALKKLTQQEYVQVEQEQTIFSQQSQLMLIDSSRDDFTTMIWPKGKFKFSVAEGFEGEAEGLLIKARETKKRILTLKQEVRQDSSIQKAIYTKTKDRSATVEKSKLNVGPKWTWLVIFSIIFVLYWGYKKYRA